MPDPQEPESKQQRRWRPVPAEMIETFDKALTFLPLVQRRKMFGCPCAFVNDQMFAGLHQESLILRLSEEDRQKLLEMEGAMPFEPMAGRPMREYVVAPPAIVASESALGAWLEKAFSYTSSLPPKAPKPPKTKAPKKAGGRSRRA